MADFSFLSDSDEESAVEQVLSQAMDQVVLEQVVAINCSGFTDSVLPTHLENRFRKLKSFPATKPTSPSLSTGKNSQSSRFNSHHHQHSVKSPKTLIENDFKNSDGAKSESDSLSDDENMLFSPSKENPVHKNGGNPKLGSGSVSSSSKSSKPSIGNENFSPRLNSNGKRGSKSKSRGGSFSSPSNSRSSSMDSLSPPKSRGCFWCSPKKDSRKKNKENMFSNMDLDWGKDNDIMSDIRTFSAKEQQKVLKKAMKEEEKISREAEKIVKWAKQVSGRMVVTGLEDDHNNDNKK